MSRVENILPHHGDALLFRDFFSPLDSDNYYQAIMNQTPWKQEPIRLFGREIMQPRLTALYGDGGRGYGYSGIVMEPEPWTPALAEIRDLLANALSEPFNVALLNLYRDGSDSMGWHRDNEKELGPHPVIASVSFGAARLFRLREYASKSDTREVELGHGSLLVMRGESQRFWEHSLLKTRKPTGPRINITFRVLK